MKKLKWFVYTNAGRYLTGMIIALTSLFAPNGGTLATDCEVFNYSAPVGLGIILIQLTYHIAMAIYLNLKK